MRLIFLKIKKLTKKNDLKKEGHLEHPSKKIKNELLLKLVKSV